MMWKVRKDIDGEDDDELTSQYEELSGAVAAIEYDSDDMPIIKDHGKKDIEPLPVVDHSQIEYPEFCKEFYIEPQHLANLSTEQVNARRKKLDIKVFHCHNHSNLGCHNSLQVTGFDCPNTVETFEELALGPVLMSAIKKQGYTAPTPVQAQAVPAILSGMDLIGLAKTGSGKTAAFTLPMMVHIMDQPELVKNDGPIALVLAPTRELASQIHVETKKFAKGFDIQVLAIFGGMNKLDQFKGLKRGAEVVVGTPGRVIDMCTMKNALKLNRVTYFVLDEADRMFDLGFEPQVRSVANNIRPDRQTLLFSATMERRVERLCRDILIDPIRITIGTLGAANADVTQIAAVLNDNNEKWAWLAPKLKDFTVSGSVIIFVSTKQGCEQLSTALNEHLGVQAASIHGDKSQEERQEVIYAFKKGVVMVLVATDVAARGLDIKMVKTVVNYDCAKDIDSHVHRIGRTGRAGDKDGVAFTLLTKKDGAFSCDLLYSMQEAGQMISPDLEELAKSSGHLKRRFSNNSGGTGSARGGRGGGGRGGSNSKGGGRGRGVRTAGIGFSDDGQSARGPRRDSDTGGASRGSRSNVMSNFKVI